jgi:hypothetical protein
MAIPILDDAQYIDKFGPHLNYEPPGGWKPPATGGATLVKPLLFLRRAMRYSAQGSGQQGNWLRALGRISVNHECSVQGVKRYKTASRSTARAAGSNGKRICQASWDEALGRRRGNSKIQAEHGPDSFAMPGGASTNEKPT